LFVEPDNLLHWVLKLSGLRHGSDNPDELEKRAVLIEQEFSSLGLDVISQVVPFGNRTYRNLVATIPGSEPDLPMLLLGAHYDGPSGSPGADDNASGVAVLLQTARLLAGTTPRRTVKLVAFTLEEPQGILRFLIGSEHYARLARLAGEEYAVALILESVGYCDHSEGSQRLPPLVRVPGTTRGDFLAVIGNQHSREYAEDFTRIAAASIPELPVIPYCAPPLLARLIPQLFLSDNASFWSQGYPALMLTDTVPLRNPHYHQPSDKVETLDIEFLAGVTKAVVKVMQRWAGT
jgi:Zn-dependent M28 family amino/carboxypeptidase